MNHTDPQLKQALAKMLPDRVAIDNRDGLYWRSSLETISDSELLHLCWLVERGLKGIENGNFAREIEGLVTQIDIDGSPFLDACISASWQHRTISLAKVKGVDIV